MADEPTKEWTKVFPSFGEYLDFCEDESYPRWGSSSRDAGDQWNGECDYKSCIKLGRDGWPEGRDHIAECRSRIHMDADLVPTLSHGVAGFTPDVPAYISGEIENMYQMNTEKSERKIVKIYVGIGYSCGTDYDDITNFGAAMCGLIDVLEALGNRVELTTTTLIGSGGYVAAEQIKIKHAEEHLDMDVVSFVLLHKGKLRKLGFNFIEHLQAHDAKSKLYWGYGTPLKAKKELIVDYEDGIVFPGIATSSVEGDRGDARHWLRSMLKEANKQSDTPLISAEIIEEVTQ